jgi:alginate O-acetyltransferase complex protein AlgI
MIFNEATYYLFFLLPCVAAFHLVARWHVNVLALRCLIISVFGVLFFVYYGYAHFGGWRGSLAVVLFLWELLTSQLYRKGSKWCLFGIIQAVLILAWFKYAGFLGHAWNDVVPHGPMAIRSIPRTWVPLGISFFTFEFIHFAADVYGGKIEQRPWGTYAAFILFFPSMVSGPIKRYEEFKPELEVARYDGALVAQGITRILAGLVKKQVLADTFGLWSDRLNTDVLWTARPLAVTGWLLAYGMRIYFDFSGYSDIAIGSGYLFGIHIPENFNWPYASRSITEFWRRWHISLGRWIFDYVYRPMGGSRLGPARTAVNLLAAFAISGLWHGAGYNFLAWGLWHGIMMVVHRFWREWDGRPSGRFWSVASIAVTFACVNVGWAFFCMDIGRAFFAIGRIVGVT